MNKIILKKISTNFYDKAEPYEKISLSKLAFFLNSSSLFSVDIFLEWLQTIDEDSFTAVNDFIMRYENNKVIVDWEFNENHEDPNKIYVTTKPKMIAILNNWKKILKLDPSPDEIIVIEDDSGKISFETKFYEEKIKC